MRAAERTALRAHLPVHYTRGFNPHPVLSLPCPRPTGVATRDDLLVLALDEVDEEPLSPSDLVERLNRSAPQGMRFREAVAWPGKISPQPRRVTFRLDLTAPQAEDVRQRLEHLQAEQTWPVDRQKKSKHRKAPRARSIDLRPMVCDLRLDDTSLLFTLVGSGELWARPNEVLRLLGLDERVDLARLVRTEAEFDF